jgi:hypothetical protein
MAREYRHSKYSFPGISESRYQAFREMLTKTTEAQKKIAKNRDFRTAADTILPGWEV